jgi:hypothetical protein
VSRAASDRPARAKDEARRIAANIAKLPEPTQTFTMFFKASDTNYPIGFCRVGCHAQRTLW